MRVEMAGTAEWCLWDIPWRFDGWVASNPVRPQIIYLSSLLFISCTFYGLPHTRSFFMRCAVFRRDGSRYNFYFLGIFYLHFDKSP